MKFNIWEFIGNPEPSKMSISMVLVIVMFLIMVALPSCSGTLQESKGEFDAIWFHQAGKYSVSIIVDNRITNKTFWNPEIIIDVPKNKKMWYETRRWWNEFNGNHNLEDSYIRLHIKSLDNINGAGWNNGKRGSGSTIRIK